MLAYLLRKKPILFLLLLSDLLKKSDEGAITISNELEDAHTTIEGLLVSMVGDPGKKIHTGRSRNDQVILATRLYYRSVAARWIAELINCVEILSKRYGETKRYSNARLYPPATGYAVDGWNVAPCFIEGSLELIRDGFSFLQAIDKNPLGASAGFGSSLPLDREYSAKLLGFSRHFKEVLSIYKIVEADTRSDFFLGSADWRTLCKVCLGH